VLKEKKTKTKNLSTENYISGKTVLQNCPAKPSCKTVLQNCPAKLREKVRYSQVTKSIGSLLEVNMPYRNARK
jgi:hypothetical protein